MRRTIRRVSGSGCVRLRHPALKLQRAGDRVHRAAELDQHAIAHDLHDAPAMGADGRLENRCPPLRQGSKRAGLIRLHEAAVADHIGDEDGGQAAFHDPNFHDAEFII